MIVSKYEEYFIIDINQNMICKINEIELNWENQKILIEITRFEHKKLLIRLIQIYQSVEDRRNLFLFANPEFTDYLIMTYF
jgi:hypothetical protein